MNDITHGQNNHQVGLGFTIFDDPRYIVKTAREAELSGFVDSVWVPEAWSFDTFSCLTYISSVTKKIKLCTGIANIFSRSPSLIAMSTSTLNLLSDGRAVLGLGISGKSVIEDWHSIKFEKPVQRLKEYVYSVRKILSGEKMDYSGTFVSVKRFKIAIPLLEKQIPIYLAAMGEKMLELCYEIAEGALVYFHPLQSLKETVMKLGPKHGRKVKIACYLPTCVSDDRDKAHEVVKRALAYYAGGMGDYYNRMLRTHGFENEAQRVRSYWQAGDRERATQAITNEIVDSIAIAGRPEDCREKILEFRRAGVDLPILIPPQQGQAQVVDFGSIGKLVE